MLCVVTEEGPAVAIPWQPPDSYNTFISNIIWIFSNGMAVSRKTHKHGLPVGGPSFRIVWMRNVLLKQTHTHTHINEFNSHAEIVRSGQRIKWLPGGQQWHLVNCGTEPSYAGQLRWPNSMINDAYISHTNELKQLLDGEIILWWNQNHSQRGN